MPYLRTLRQVRGLHNNAAVLRCCTYCHQRIRLSGAGIEGLMEGLYEHPQD